MVNDEAKPEGQCQSRRWPALGLHEGFALGFLYADLVLKCPSYFTNHLITYACSGNTIRKHQYLFRDKNLRQWPIWFSDLCFPVYQNLRKKALYIYLALCKPKYVKNHKCMKYSAGDDLVFKIILRFTKGLFVNILKVPLSFSNMTIWLEFLRFDFPPKLWRSKDMKISFLKTHMNTEFGYIFQV